MTPKEKSEKLIAQYKAVLMTSETDCGNEVLCTLIAIQNAKIAVQEILLFMDQFDLDLHMNIQFRWWEKVEEELDKN